MPAFFPKKMTRIWPFSPFYQWMTNHMIRWPNLWFGKIPNPNPVFGFVIRHFQNSRFDLDSGFGLLAFYDSIRIRDSVKFEFMIRIRIRDSVRHKFKIWIRIRIRSFSKSKIGFGSGFGNSENLDSDSDSDSTNLKNKIRIRIRIRSKLKLRFGFEFVFGRSEK